MSEVKQVLSALTSLGLVQDDIYNDPDLAEWLSSSQDELEGLWQDSSEYIEKLTVDELLKMPFVNAQKAIKQFTIKKRIDFLDEITIIRTHYYNQLARYGEGNSKDEQISAKEFRSLLGKVKHIEIVQNWLYGII